ncbi:alpha/beta hydrolase [Spirillospora sp. NPDC052242]
MTTRTPRSARAALAAGTAAALTGLAAAALVLLPPPSWTAWQLGLLLVEFSLLAAVPAAAGLALSLLARRRAAGRSRAAATAASAANALVLAGALLPAASAWADARSHGADLGLGDHLAGLATTADREPETVVYARPGGTALELDVWRPRPGGGPRPVVVNVHGGAEDLPQSLLPRWDAWLADRGHVVFDVDYRVAPPGRWQMPAADLLCALGWIAEHAPAYGGDPGRIAVMGQSAGGLAVLQAVYTAPGRIPPSCPAEPVPVRTVVAWYSITDLASEAVPWRQRHSPIGAELAAATETMMGGSPAERPAAYRAASPIRHVRPGLPPTLLIHGGRDMFAPPRDSRALAARLTAAGVPNRLVEISHAGHMFDLNWGGFASRIARHAIVGHFAAHLRPPASRP